MSDFSDPRVKAAFGAGLTLLGRMGMKSSRIGYSSPEDGEPIVWYVLAVDAEGNADAGAGLNPLVALTRLLEQMVDGGTCNHCKKPTAFSVDPVADPLEVASEVTFCWYRFDPELATFRRSCEGVVP